MNDYRYIKKSTIEHKKYSYDCISMIGLYFKVSELTACSINYGSDVFILFELYQDLM